jgi:hypothetical protein
MHRSLRLGAGFFFTVQQVFKIDDLARCRDEDQKDEYCKRMILFVFQAIPDRSRLTYLGTKLVEHNEAAILPTCC